MNNASFTNTNYKLKDILDQPVSSKDEYQVPDLKSASAIIHQRSEENSIISLSCQTNVQSMDKCVERCSFILSNRKSNVFFLKTLINS